MIFVTLCALVASVVPNEGAPLTCAENEHPVMCGWMCQPSCVTALEKGLMCGGFGNCKDDWSCTCINKYYRHPNGTCVPLSACPIDKFECGGNEEVNPCGDSCEKNCGNLNKSCDRQSDSCTQPACVCKRGYARIDEWEGCVRVEDCPK